MRLELRDDLGEELVDLSLGKERRQKLGEKRVFLVFLLCEIWTGTVLEL